MMNSSLVETSALGRLWRFVMQFWCGGFADFLVIQGVLREVGLGFRRRNVGARVGLRRGKSSRCGTFKSHLLRSTSAAGASSGLRKGSASASGAVVSSCRGLGDLVVEPHLLGASGLCWGIERGGVKARGNDGDAEVLAQVGVGAVSPDDFGGLAGSLLDVVGDFRFRP